MAMDKTLVYDLLKIDAVQINPDHYFTWTSGVKSPIYCDNRLIMSYPDIRKKTTIAFTEKIKQLKWDADVIAGCATAGIPHAAWLSEALELPMVYVRSSAKLHGKGNQIEGRIREGDRVLVIEDLISTGGSSIQAAQALRRAGAEVTGVLAIFSYGLDHARENFKAAGFTYDSLTDFDQLLQALRLQGQLTEKEQREMLEWRDSL
jgi:orotate phosphoribosyltransferase